MSTTSEPHDPGQEPRSLSDLREIRELGLNEQKRVPLPPPPPPSETRRTTPLAEIGETRPASPKPRTSPEAAGASHGEPRAALTDDEYRKIRARLREDFVIVPKRLLRNAGSTVGATLLMIALVGFVTARQAGRSAALGFMKTQLGEMVERNQEDLDLETREALARSREAAEAALDAHRQAVMLLEQLKRQLTSVETLSTRVTKVEHALERNGK